MDRQAISDIMSEVLNAVVPSAALTSLPPLTYLSQGGKDETTILPHVPSVNVSEKIYFPAAQKLHPPRPLPHPSLRKVIAGGHTLQSGQAHLPPRPGDPGSIRAGATPRLPRCDRYRGRATQRRASANPLARPSCWQPHWSPAFPPRFQARHRPEGVAAEQVASSQAPRGLASTHCRRGARRRRTVVLRRDQRPRDRTHGPAAHLKRPQQELDGRTKVLGKPPQVRAKDIRRPTPPRSSPAK